MGSRSMSHDTPRASADDSEREALRAGRAALLDLLADVLLGELEPPVARALAADPALAEALRPPSDEADVRALRAEYARLLLLEAPPYASLYLEAPPVIGGETARRWETTLARIGLSALPTERAASRDHAGLYLRALAQAERVGASRVAQTVLAEALRWLPQYLTALQQADPQGFYGRVAQLAAYALGESARAVEPPAGSTAPAASETPPDALPEDDRLRTLTRWLCTPLWSGWYLTPSSLRAFAHAFGSPPGRTERAALLEQAFEASGLDARTDELLDTLLATLDTWRAAADDWSAQLGGWDVHLAEWRARLAQTRDILTTMREEARAQASGAPFAAPDDASASEE